MSRSPRETIKALKSLIHENTNDEENERRGSELCDEMMDHIERKSVFMRMMGLVNCRNIIMILAVFTGIAFLFALFHDLAFLFGNFLREILEMFWRIVIKEHVTLMLGFTTAILCTFFKKNIYLGKLYIFEDFTSLFGCILFSISVRYYRMCYFLSNQEDVGLIFQLLPTCFFIIAAIYTKNKSVGAWALISIYEVCGFRIGSMFGGYYAGFLSDKNLLIGVSVSFILLSVYIFFEAKRNMKLPKFLGVFKPSVYLISTFVGCLAALIRSNYWYNKFYLGDPGIHVWLSWQVVMGVFCLGSLYFGNVFYSSKLTGVGGTFLVLWLMDIQVYLMRNCKHLSLVLFVVLVNLLGLYHIMKKYPKFFVGVRKKNE